jgi:hypothetical protein
MNWKTLALGAALSALMLAEPSEADAASFSGTGYPCRVAHIPRTIPGAIIVLGPSGGNFGIVTVSFYSEPFCGGTFVRSATAYSTGSNVTDWTDSDTHHPHTEASLLALHAGLQRAAEAGERVFFAGQTFEGPFVGSTSYQLHYVRFADF